MQRLHLLATGLIASSCFSAIAAAQAPTSTVSPGSVVPTFSTTPPPFHSFSASPSSAQPPTFSLNKPSAKSDKSIEMSSKSKNIEVINEPAHNLTLDNTIIPQHPARLPAATSRDALIASNNGPCYKLRVYGFTPPDLKSQNPRPSSATSCTPAAIAHMKPLQATSPADVK